MFEIANQRISSDFSPIKELLNASFERISELHKSGRDITGVPSGFRELDRITAGFQPSNLMILAARPGMGKTSLALNIASHVAIREGLPVAIFSIEMSRDEVTQRLMCAEGKVDSSRLRTGKLAQDEWPRLTDACSRLSTAPIYVDDTAGVTALEIKAKTRRLKTRHPNLGLVVVDYLQLMSGGGRFDNRVQEISQISAPAEADGARPRRAGDGAVAAVARRRAAGHQGQAPAAVRPARIRLDRAGRRRRHVHLPRRLLRPARASDKGDGRDHRRQAPQRPARTRSTCVYQGRYTRFANHGSRDAA